MVPSLADQEIIIAQLRDFVRGHGRLFSKPLAQQQAVKVSAVTWWEDWDAVTPELATFALRILTQPYSASGFEHNWSAFEHIYSKEAYKVDHATVGEVSVCTLQH